MKKSKRVMRRAILSRLFDTLQEHYAIDYTRDWFVNLSLHEIDAILAFKSETTLDELRQALDRLEEGRFGICISCKEELSSQTLNDDPARRICSNCENTLAHHGIIHGGTHVIL